VRRAAIIGLLLGAGHPPAASAEDALQPYQLVRSLQLVQDRIAAGDHAALPMQAKLLEMADTRLRAADAEDFKDPKNFRALLVYGMSGGKPHHRRRRRCRAPRRIRKALPSQKASLTT